MSKNKDCFIQIRITAEQKLELKERAMKMGYSTVSSFLIDSAMGNCMGAPGERFQLLNEWYSTYQKSNTELSRIGSNLNQLARYENILSINGIFKKELLYENTRLRQQCVSLFEQLKLFNTHIFNELKKIK